MTASSSAPAVEPVTLIKICGLTSLTDAQAVVAAGADALGLMFSARSARYVQRDVAAQIASAVAGKLCRVGLFIDAPATQVQAVLADVELDLLQFHGQETPAYCESFGLPYCKAIAAGEGFDPAVSEARYASAAMLMLDAVLDGQFGGTGAGIDFKRWPPTPSKRWVLAGGLDASNVQTAVEQLKPYAVDVSSGVELLSNGKRCKGRKDSSQIHEFVAAVRAADLT
jgi:phosphoribosylanthranilate isomerase